MADKKFIEKYVEMQIRGLTLDYCLDKLKEFKPAITRNELIELKNDPRFLEIYHADTSKRIEESKINVKVQLAKNADIFINSLVKNAKNKKHPSLAVKSSDIALRILFDKDQQGTTEQKQAVQIVLATNPSKNTVNNS